MRKYENAPGKYNLKRRKRLTEVLELNGTQILKGSDGWRKWVAGKNWRSPRNTMRPSAMNWNMGFGVGACSRTGPWVPSVFGLSEACAVLLWLAEDLEGRNEEEDIDCFESSVISVQSKLLTPVTAFFFFFFNFYDSYRFITKIRCLSI